MKKYEPPDTSKAESSATLARAGLSAIPIIGGPAAELINAVVTPALNKRKEQWMNDVAHGLRTLEEAGCFRLDDLQDNEDFIDAVLVATTIAMKTHNEEKRKMLRNAVLNATLPNSLESVMQHIFLNLIDEFTEWHIKILEFLREPAAFYDDDKHFETTASSLDNIIVRAFPEIKDQRHLYDLVINDLYARNLISIKGLHTVITAQGLRQSRTTGMGNDFLSYIMIPKGLES